MLRRSAALILASPLWFPLLALDPAEPSRIAIATAAARAVGSHDPDPFTRNPDWLAGQFLSPAELALIFSHPINRAVDQDPRISVQDPDNLPLIRLNTVRTRFIDDRLQQAVRAGAAQVVILDAGLDSRPYRFRGPLEKTKIFEVDTPGMQQLKKRRVHDVFGAAPPNVTYVTLDMNRQNLAEGLRKAGFRSSERTFLIWEGGSMYHPEQVVLDVLHFIAQSAAGSLLVMDFAYKEDVARARANPNSPQQRFDAAWGEPWLFGVPRDPGPEAFFRGLGLAPVELLPAGGPAAIRRYLTHRDLSIVGQGVAFNDEAPITLAELSIR
ncbi:MAG TPA: SAM-dependent methyltransferase [Bryobacteraceae bacterium]|jgi:methyltransferase (TIGR00027 family)